MPELEKSFTLNLPQQVAFSRCLSVALLLKFLSQNNSRPVSVVPDAPDGQMKLNQTYSFYFGKQVAKSSFTCRVVEFESPDHIVIEGQQSFQPHYRMEYLISESPAGSEVQMKINYEVAPGVLGTLLGPAIKGIQWVALETWAMFLQTHKELDGLDSYSTPERSSNQVSSQAGPVARGTPAAAFNLAAVLSASSSPSEPGSDLVSKMPREEGIDFRFLIVCFAILLFALGYANSLFGF